MAFVYDRATGTWTDDSPVAPATEAPPPPTEGMPPPREPSGLLRRTVGDAATALAKGALVSLPQAAVGLANFATLGLAEKPLGAIGDQLNDMGARFDKQYSTQHQAQAEEVANTKGFLPTIGAYLSRPGYLVDTAIEQLPSMYGGAKIGQAAVGGAKKMAAMSTPEALAAATKGAAIGEGVVTAGQNIEQIRQDAGGETTFGQRALGALSGAATGGIAFGMGKLANRLGVSDIDVLMAGGRRPASEVAGEGAAGVFKRAPGMLSRGARGATSEGMEELTQSGQEQVMQNLAVGRPLMEGVPEAMGQGLVLGGAMGGTVAAAVHNNKLADGVAAIQLLSQPPTVDAAGKIANEKDYTDALRALTDLHPPGTDARRDMNTWRMEQMERLAKGEGVDWSQFGAIATNQQLLGLAESTVAGINERKAAADAAQKALVASMNGENLVDDGMGNLVNAPATLTQMEQRGLRPTAEEQAMAARVQQAITQNDTEFLARHFGKLVRPDAETAAQTAGAPIPPAEPPPAAPKKKGGPKSHLSDESLMSEIARQKELQAAGSDIFSAASLKQLEAEAKARVEARNVGPQPYTAQQAMTAMKRNGKNPVPQGTVGEVITKLNSGDWAGAVSAVQSLQNGLKAGASPDLVSAIHTLGAIVNARLPKDGTVQPVTYVEPASEQTTPVDKGAKSQSGNAQNNAAVPGTSTEASPSGNAAAQPTEKAPKTPVGTSIPYDTVSYDETTRQKSKSSGISGIIDYAGRKVVMRNVNGVMVPFYLSTGHGGKADVASGKWYPFFGIGADGWLNKTGGKQMMDHYGSAELRAVAEELNNTIGDIRTDDTTPKVGATGAHIDFINQHMAPTESGTANSTKNLHANIISVLDRISATGATNEASIVRQESKPGSSLNSEAGGKTKGKPVRQAAPAKPGGNATAQGESVRQEVAPRVLTKEDIARRDAAREELAATTSKKAREAAARKHTPAAIADVVNNDPELGADVLEVLGKKALQDTLALLTPKTKVELAKLANRKAVDAQIEAEQAADEAKAKEVPANKAWDELRGDRVTPGPRYLPTWAEAEKFVAKVAEEVAKLAGWSKAAKNLAADIAESKKVLARLEKEQKPIVAGVAKAESRLEAAKENLAAAQRQADYHPDNAGNQARLRNMRAELTARETDLAQAESLAGFHRYDETITIEKAHIDEMQKNHAFLLQKIKTTEADKIYAGKLDDLMTKFKVDRNAGALATNDDLLRAVAATRFEPVRQALADVQAKLRKASLEAAALAAAKDRLADLADKASDENGLSPALANEFRALYKTVFKKAGKSLAAEIKAAQEAMDLDLRGGSGGTVGALQVALMEANGKQRLDDVLAAVQKVSTNPVLKELAATLRKLGVAGVTVEYTPEARPGMLTADKFDERGTLVEPGKRGWVRGSYNQESNTITIYAGGETPTTILHEAVHALTVRAINDAAALMGKATSQLEMQKVAGLKRMYELYKFLKEHPTLQGEYAFKNMKEFVAEVQSNPELQGKLKNIPLPKTLFGGTLQRLGNAMRAFVDNVLNLLGVPRSQTNALTASLEATGAFFAANNSRNNGTVAGTEPDALVTPADALSVPFANAKRYVDQLDRAIPNRLWAKAKAKAFDALLWVTSSETIARMVAHDPKLTTVKAPFEKYFDFERAKSAVRKIVSDLAYDGFLRETQIALGKTTDFEKYNRLMGWLASEASRFNLDLTKDYAANNFNRGSKEQLEPRLKAHVDNLHQEYNKLKQVNGGELARLLKKGELVNRQMHAMQSAALARGIINAHQSSGAAAAASTDLRNKFWDRLNILQDERKLTNTDPTRHYSGLSAQLDGALRELFTYTQETYPNSDLAEEMRQMEEAYLKGAKSPYMHLGRHGMYRVRFNAANTTDETVAKLAKLLAPYGVGIGPFVGKSSSVFLRVEDAHTADEIHKLMLANKALLGKDGDGKPDISVGKISEVAGVDSAFGMGKMLKELRSRMKAKYDDMQAVGGNPQLKAAYETLVASMTDTMLDMLEVNSARQANRQRDSVPGYSTSYLQNFAKRAQWGEASIANNFTADMASEAFRDMQDAVNDLGKTNVFNAERGQQVHDELATRFSQSLKGDEAPLIHAASVFGNNFYLALSPAYAIGNLMQPYMLTLPYLGGRFGFVKAAKTLGRSSDDVRKLLWAAVKSGAAEGGWRGVLDAKINLAGVNMPSAELEFVRHLLRSGIVDSTQAHELGRMADGTVSGAASTAKVLSLFNHYTEVANRLSTGLAAYRLASGMEQMKREKYAIDAVGRTQFNYAEHNTARAIGRNGFMGAATPLFMQFQRFAFFTMEHYAQMATEAIGGRNIKTEDKAAARKALAGSFAAAALVSGTMGLPFVTAMVALANAFRSGEDDDKDLRALYREWLASVFGKDMAELVAKGPISRTLGVDLTGSLGQQDLIPGSRFLADRRAWEDKMKDQSKTMFGPALNAGFDIYGGIHHIKDGDLAEGVKAVLPRALKGPWGAVQTAKEGAFTNKSGTTLPIPVTGWDYFKMAGGWTPARKAEQAEANFYFQSQLTQEKQDRKQAQNKAVRAFAEGDSPEALDALMEYQMAHPTAAKLDVRGALAARARGQAMGALSGTGIIDSNRRHFPMLNDYTWNNSGATP